MTTIRRRLDLIASLRTIDADEFSKGETAAFHGRKSLEGVAFGCLVATEHSLKHVPRDARGQWSAEKIFKSLKSNNLLTLPSPSIIRTATKSEQQDNNVKVVIQGVPERRLSHDELVTIYQRLHRWIHEVNPYTEQDQSVFYSKRGQALWDDLERLNRFIEKHYISISGEGFFCLLRDDHDRQTKILPLSKVGSL